MLCKTISCVITSVDSLILIKSEMLQNRCCELAEENLRLR